MPFFRKSLVIYGCLASLTAFIPFGGAEASPVKHHMAQHSHVKDTKNTAQQPKHAKKKIVLSKKNRTSISQRHTKRWAAAVTAGSMVAMANEDALDGKRTAFSVPSLHLDSTVALVYDQNNQQVLYSKNSHAVVPIASITKLMTGLLISEADLPMNELIRVTEADVDTIRHSSSRLQVGTVLTRGELLHLALMSSENRAAHALARTFPGGEQQFVKLMNGKANSLGMFDTHYIEPTGLSSSNRSSARDLAILVAFAAENPTLRDLTTSPESEVEIGHRTLQYRNSNRLIKSPNWDIALQKTGYITEAGRCMVLQAQMATRKVIMVLLDASGNFSRLADAEKVRRWVESLPSLHPR